MKRLKYFLAAMEGTCMQSVSPGQARSDDVRSGSLGEPAGPGKETILSPQVPVTTPANSHPIIEKTLNDSVSRQFLVDFPGNCLYFS